MSLKVSSKKKNSVSSGFEKKYDEDMRPAGTQTSPNSVEEGGFQCEFCCDTKKTFRTRVGLLSHLRTCPKKPSPSPKLSRTVQKRSWKLIEKTPHLENVKKSRREVSGFSRLSCPFCNQGKTRSSSFQTPQLQKAHIRQFHGFLCSRCQILSQDALSAHGHWRWCCLPGLLGPGVCQVLEADATRLYWSLALERGKKQEGLGRAALKRCWSETDLSGLDLDAQFIQDICFQAALNEQIREDMEGTMEMDDSDLEAFFTDSQTLPAPDALQGWDLFPACNTDLALNEAVSFFTRFLFE